MRVLLTHERTAAQVFSLQQQTNHKLLFLEVRLLAAGTNPVLLRLYVRPWACMRCWVPSQCALSSRFCCLPVQEHVLKGDQTPVVLIGHSIGMGRPCISCISCWVLLAPAVGCRSFKRPPAHLPCRRVYSTAECPAPPAAWQRGRAHPQGEQQAAAAPRPPPLPCTVLKRLHQTEPMHRHKDVLSASLYDSFHCIGEGLGELAAWYERRWWRSCPFCSSTPTPGDSGAWPIWRHGRGWAGPPQQASRCCLRRCCAASSTLQVV